ncbi:hypothetical protein [Flavobacterium cerinum]|uniref:DUF5723 domain-containing protein n=1 Tax=Flavobacterium cerinum TaxID=2502784 RepID=A0A444H6V0_9FLAO|nr:hypothetical protein [Flavobacterium cerinum]RWW98928.1 hypothetical protein EPI11_13465 [Flavobacterium cerinum]
MILRIVLLLFPLLMSAQDAVIFSNDKYSGISSVGFSPTQPFFNPNSWDINIVAVDIFIQNNYTYISKQSIIGLADADIKSVSLRDKIMGISGPNLQDYYNKDKGGYHFSSDILGPSASLSVDINQKKYTFGIFTRLRTQGSAIDIDNYSRFNNTNIDAVYMYNFSPFKTNFMNWGEIGVNVATQIFQDKEYKLVLGGNLKYEMGYDAMNLNNKNTANLRRTVNSTDLSTNTEMANYDIEASYVTGYDSEGKQYNIKPNGKGFGLDIGLAFTEWDFRMEDYNLKMSFNILDIGYINFKGENHRFNGKPFDFNTLDGKKIESPQEFFQIMSEEIYGNPNASLAGTKFTIGLPTSLHFNISKRIRENHYLNFDLVQRAPVFENSLKRSNIANVSYSVQKRIIGYGTSMSLYEYRDLQFGAYLRLASLIIGSENFFPLFFKQDKLHAADIYIGLKIYPFSEKSPDKIRRSKCRC